MRFWIIALISTALISGCKTAPVGVEPCGPDDFIKTSIGSTITGANIPVISDQPVVVKIRKVGQWMSQDCWNRIEKHQ